MVHWQHETSRQHPGASQGGGFICSGAVADYFKQLYVYGEFTETRLYVRVLRGDS